MYPCGYCDKTYQHVSGKNRHEREKHRDARPHKFKEPCTVCGRKMRSSRTKKSERPDLTTYGGNGKCQTCYSHELKTRNKREHTYPCRSCHRTLRPWGYTREEMPGTLSHAGDRLCHRCWKHKKRSSNAHYIPTDQRIDLTAAARVRRLVEARYTGQQRKYMLDILGIGGDL